METDMGMDLSNKRLHSTPSEITHLYYFTYLWKKMAKINVKSVIFDMFEVINHVFWLKNKRPGEPGPIELFVNMKGGSTQEEIGEFRPKKEKFI